MHGALAEAELDRQVEMHPMVRRGQVVQVFNIQDFQQLEALRGGIPERQVGFESGRI